MLAAPRLFRRCSPDCCHFRTHCFKSHSNYLLLFELNILQSLKAMRAVQLQRAWEANNAVVEKGKKKVGSVLMTDR